jgi:hypothetical protein
LNKVTLIYPFPTPFSNEKVSEVAGHNYGFSRYNQVPIAKEVQEKTMFVMKFGLFAYMAIPFGLKNSPTIFLRIVFKVFHKFIHKTMAIYLNNRTIYSLLKNHIH